MSEVNKSKIEVTKKDSGLYGVIVDGSDYEFEKWGAEEATDTMLAIAALIGKPIGMAIAAFGIDKKEEESGDKKDFDPNIVGMIMESLTTNIGTNRKLCMELIKKLCSGPKVFCNGAQVLNYNNHYQDRIDHQFRVVRAGLEVQYGNFFSAVSGFAGFRRKSPLAAVMNPAR